MGLLNFQYQKNIASKEHFLEEIAEDLRNDGTNISEYKDEISVSGLKSYFSVGSASIKAEDNKVRVDGKVKPSTGAMITFVICILLTLVCLFKEMGTEEDVVVALLSGILGVPGLFVSIAMFLAGKEFLRQNLLLRINGVGK